ncbi:MULTISPECIES: hypothetical protein [Hafniaceae]|uniref:hypothetical protein n=1 Tax=Hafniaceae TaxID=1903412 RepID=UPI00061D2021|nr:MULTISPECIES: hypothetical protein [Hafniaceae]KKF38385.1 hypothetical protein PU01_23675 [Hafnia alvei]MBW3477272.1 hypothetical protein [Hafnia alvei]STQ70460.1 Uncharacterised protein [Hafnia alvei]
MAQEFDVFAGSYVTAFYGSDVKNTDFDNKDFVEIPEVAAFPETGMERAVIDVPNYSTKYNRKLVGRGSVPSIDMTVNYIPGSVHEKLVKACEDGTRIQVKFVYWVDATKTVGVGVVYNGFLSKSTLTGGDSDVVGRAFTLEVDGGPVVQAVVSPEE